MIDQQDLSLSHPVERTRPVLLLLMQIALINRIKTAGYVELATPLMQGHQPS